MTKYRFKTEQEFFEEYGGNWKDIVSWNDIDQMDHLFGMVINVPIDFNQHIICRIDSWYIFSKMVKMCAVNYNDKKTLVYD